MKAVRNTLIVLLLGVFTLNARSIENDAPGNGTQDEFEPAIESATDERLLNIEHNTAMIFRTWYIQPERILLFLNTKTLAFETKIEFIAAYTSLFNMAILDSTPMMQRRLAVIRIIKKLLEMLHEEKYATRPLSSENNAILYNFIQSLANLIDYQLWSSSYTIKTIITEAIELSESAQRDLGINDILSHGHPYINSLLRPLINERSPLEVSIGLVNMSHLFRGIDYGDIEDAAADRPYLVRDLFIHILFVFLKFLQTDSSASREDVIRNEIGAIVGHMERLLGGHSLSGLGLTLRDHMETLQNILISEDIPKDCIVTTDRTMAL